ncbi:MAG: DUF5915 domain-containing protein [Rickettsiales bacterium]|nr:DUF5915 domain-containing protein [Rickettsiales bacterium]
MYAKDSVHLQNFPKLANFEADMDLVATMDTVRTICSCALAIRDKNNLRVRLPLNKITIVSEQADDFREFSSVIAEEINVKSVEFLDRVEDFAENKLVLNFQKIGSAIGSKMPDLIRAAQSGRWKITDSGSLRICDVELEKDEFSLQLVARKKNVFPVEGYNIVIMLDLAITEELKCEGAARDLVRLVQQLRKNAAVDIDAIIEISVKTSYELLLRAIAEHGNYIKEQILAKDLTIISDENYSTSGRFFFREEIEGNTVEISFNTVS